MKRIKVYWVNQVKKTMEVHMYDDSGSFVKSLGFIQVPLVSTTIAEMDTLVIKRLSGQVQYLQIKDTWLDGISICREWE